MSNTRERLKHIVAQIQAENPDMEIDFFTPEDMQPKQQSFNRYAEVMRHDSQPWQGDEAGPSELEMHRADYKAVRDAGFESPGELLAAYRNLTDEFFILRRNYLDCQNMLRLADEEIKKMKESGNVWRQRYNELDDAVSTALKNKGRAALFCPR